MPRTGSPAVIVGSGPGIGANTAAEFASKRFDKIALVARNAEQLAKDAATVASAVEDGDAASPVKTSVKTYATDITDSAALGDTLARISSELGAPEFVLFNAARVRPSTLLEEADEEILHELNISTVALHNVASWAVPGFLALSKEGDTAAKPTLMVTSSSLPEAPVPELFSLSLSKAAQKNLVLSLRERFKGDGIHVCLLTVGGPVRDSDPVLNAANIAARAWELYDQDREDWSLEVRIGDD